MAGSQSSSCTVLSQVLGFLPFFFLEGRDPFLFLCMSDTWPKDRYREMSMSVCWVHIVTRKEMNPFVP